MFFTHLCTECPRYENHLLLWLPLIFPAVCHKIQVKFYTSSTIVIFILVTYSLRINYFYRDATFLIRTLGVHQVVRFSTDPPKHQSCKYIVEQTAFSSEMKKVGRTLLQSLKYLKCTQNWLYFLNKSGVTLSMFCMEILHLVIVFCLQKPLGILQYVTIIFSYYHLSRLYEFLFCHWANPLALPWLRQYWKRFSF